MQLINDTGSNLFEFCEINSSDGSVGSITGRIQISGSPLLLVAAIYDGIGNAIPPGTTVQVTVTSPSGMVYNTDVNTASVFAKTDGGSLQALLVQNPAAGYWTLNCKCIVSGVRFNASLQTVPVAAPVTTVLTTLDSYYTGTPNMTAGEYTNQAFSRWYGGPAAALYAALTGTPAFNLAAYLTALFGFGNSTSQNLLVQVAGLHVNGIVNTVQQTLSILTPEIVVNGLENGSAQNQLADWTVLTGSWGTQNLSNGPFATSFTVSDAWCKKYQLVDLVNGLGLSTAYLDRMPPISFTDMLACQAPADGNSSYTLLVELRDANQTVLKRFETGAISVPSTVDANGVLQWSGIGTTFYNYGVGVRYVYFEHGGLNPAGVAPANGLRLSGAQVDVQMGLPQVPIPELIVNGSATDGLTGWTVLSNPNNWTVETGSALQCPGSLGTNAFVVASGWGKKCQTIDLVAAGYSPALLDTSPQINFGDWVCILSSCMCSYYVTVNVLDSQHQVLASYASGTVNVPMLAAGFDPFTRLAGTIINYPAGARFIYYEHGATHDGTHSNTAKITGTSVTIASSPVEEDDQYVPSRTAGVRNLAAAAVAAPITATTVAPYKWVCLLESPKPNNMVGLCSAWLMNLQNGNNSHFTIGTAAHCVYDLKNGWVNETQVTPGLINSGTPPYNTAHTVLNQKQVPLKYFTENQAQPISKFGELYDYAMILQPAQNLNWDTDGFRPTVLDNQGFSNLAAVITAFPTKPNPPYKAWNMYSQPVTLSLPWISSTTTVDSTTDFGPGASGGCSYTNQNAAYQAVCIMSWQKSGYLWGMYKYNTRITQEVLTDFQNFAVPLTAGDGVDSFVVLTRTADEVDAGTSYPFNLSMLGKSYVLGAATCMNGGDPFDRGRFSGFDLTQRLKADFPALTVGDLLGKAFSLQMDIGFVFTGWFVNACKLEFAAFYLNGKIMYVQKMHNWFQFHNESESFNFPASLPA